MIASNVVILQVWKYEPRLGKEYDLGPIVGNK